MNQTIPAPAGMSVGYKAVSPAGDQYQWETVTRGGRADSTRCYSYLNRHVATRKKTRPKSSRMPICGKMVTRVPFSNISR